MPTSSTQPLRASSTRQSRTRAVGATTAMRLICAGRTTSAEGIEHLLRSRCSRSLGDREGCVSRARRRGRAVPGAHDDPVPSSLPRASASASAPTVSHQASSARHRSAGSSMPSSAHAASRGRRRRRSVTVPACGHASPTRALGRRPSRRTGPRRTSRPRATRRLPPPMPAQRAPALRPASPTPAAARDGARAGRRRRRLPRPSARHLLELLEAAGLAADCQADESTPSSNAGRGSPASQVGDPILDVHELEPRGEGPEPGGRVSGEPGCEDPPERCTAAATACCASSRRGCSGMALA